MKKLLKKIKQYFCNHAYHWTWSEGGEVKAYYDEFAVGTCVHCGHNTFRDE